jgi:RepB DNA-primase from phage plasmid
MLKRRSGSTPRPSLRPETSVHAKVQEGLEDHQEIDSVYPSVLRTRSSRIRLCVLLANGSGYSGEGEHRFRREAERHSGAKVNSSRSAATQQLAHTYGGDLASTDWRHLGRLAGFTNQKLQRRTPGGYAPWVTIVEAVLASAAQDLLHSATQRMTRQTTSAAREAANHLSGVDNQGLTITAQGAVSIYQRWMECWHIQERFSQPDWSIVDLWLARKLLALHIPVAQVQTILHLGSRVHVRRSPLKNGSSASSYASTVGHRACYSAWPGHRGSGGVVEENRHGQPLQARMADACFRSSKVTTTNIAPRPTSSRRSARGHVLYFNPSTRYRSASIRW